LKQRESQKEWKDESITNGRSTKDDGIFFLPSQYLGMPDLKPRT
jgi:hypothetical protein